MYWAALNPGNGQILYTGPLDDNTPLPDYSEDGLEILVTDIPLSDARHYLDLDTDTIKIYPPRPTPFHQFDFDAEHWIDTRTAEDVSAELATARNGTYLAKEEFLIRCMEFNILTPPEAIHAAQGNIPAAFEQAIAVLPAYARDLIRITWPTVRNVARMDPLIVVVAQLMQIGTEELDQLFMVRMPSAPGALTVTQSVEQQTTQTTTQTVTQGTGTSSKSSTKSSVKILAHTE